MKILIDSSGRVHLTDAEKRDSLELCSSGEIFQYSPSFTLLKESGGVFDKVEAFSKEPEEFKSSLLVNKTK